ncbi:helix-turn-helix domain-containing protein [Prauserella endophytica]|uniref:Helix-turn-helix transcriptional regulator n=1 Tax=Prauserella endophytica TaxID=1592324 RepID=A0ABY2S804_9PSEU|nr:helix-turn-helix domain-containing protein [Prauserella endophytica]PXY21815.1 transcriptional regulator [Prauserella coralliicola]TKG71606.1 helix-turn-helix transcriptional regulator [Prauserella endophytica]
MSDNELGTLLRARREAVTPERVGLPSGPRRRTPGLRRSELATLAGISVEYLTRLEQGRDRHPSAQVLGAIADALRLSLTDRQLLAHTAKSLAGAALCPAGMPPARTVRPTVRALLDRLEPAPALLLNRLSDVLAYTPAYERLAGPAGLLDAEAPNLVRFLFTDARAHTVFADWERVADEHVANLKLGPPGDDPHLAALTDELTVTAGAPFADRLRCPPSLVPDTGELRLVHPEVGGLLLAYETLALPDDDQRLLVYLPADEATGAALDQLTGRRPGSLRAVTG